MLEVNVKEAPAKLGKLLKQVEHGQHVLLTRKGKEVACLVPPRKKRRLPSLKKFRQTIAVPGKGLSAAVLAARDEERKRDTDVLPRQRKRENPALEERGAMNRTGTALKHCFQAGAFSV